MAGIQKKTNKQKINGPGSSRVLDALSWYLCLILTHSVTKLINNIVDQNLEGRALVAPPLDPQLEDHCCLTN